MPSDIIKGSRSKHSNKLDYIDGLRYKMLMCNIEKRIFCNIDLISTDNYANADFALHTVCRMHIDAT